MAGFDSLGLLLLPPSDTAVLCIREVQSNRSGLSSACGPLLVLYHVGCLTYLINTNLCLFQAKPACLWNVSMSEISPRPDCCMYSRSSVEG